MLEFFKIKFLFLKNRKLFLNQTIKYAQNFKMIMCKSERVN